MQQDHAHPQESEIIVGHPEGKMKISTSDMKFQPPKSETVDNYGTVTKPTVKKSEEELFKTAKTKMASAMTAMAMLGIPHPTATLDNMTAPQPHQVQSAHQIQAPNELKDSPDLKPIRMIESSGGKNLAHPEVEDGINAGTKAYGQYGLMPLQVIDTLNHDKHLSAKYPKLASMNYLQDQDQIHSALKKDPELEKAVANSHWKRLRDRFDGNVDKMAYAWLHGISGTLKATDDEIKQHPYVQKYHKFRQMLQLEEPQKMQKSESSASLKSIQKFVPLTATGDDKHSIHLINEAIKSGNIHNFSNVGHFTHDSFLAGFERDNSWLIKVESVSRPAIVSARHGLQAVKEVAFYDAANKVFDLGQFTPKAILGEVVRDGKDWPAAAIKMYPEQYVSAAQLEQEKPGSVHGIMEKYRRNGVLHKMAIMLYILGDADAHGGNVLTNGTSIKMIDHGTSFADAQFDPANDKNTFIPYILRQGYIRDHWSPEQKLAKMPRISDPNIEEQVRHWVLSLDAANLLQILNRFYIDPKPTLERLKVVQKLVGQKANGPPDEIINSLWVTGLHSGEKNETNTRRH
jgi:hypothetical protein